MKQTVILTLIISILSGCAAGISRTGYDSQDLPEVASVSNCNIAIKYQANYTEEEVDIIGEIKAYDTGFSVYCDEAYVLNIFCEEACKQGADLVNITKEKYPSWKSSCYRAKAEFLKFKDRDMIKSLVSDKKYAPELIIERSQETAQRTKKVIEAGVMGGLLGGLMVGF